MMRLRSLDLVNFGPHHHLHVALAPLTVITGGNGTGKTHVAEALRLALTGDWLQRGLTRKQDRAALLSDGAEDGSIVVEAADGFRAAVNIKSGKVERTPGPVAYLEQCCDPRLIVDQPTADLRAMLLDLLKIAQSRDHMAAELIERGHDRKRVAEWANGQDCANAAAEARGAWKSITGEVYGHVKAGTWRADAPTVEPGALEAVAAEIADLKARIDALRETAAKDEALREAAARVALLRAKAEDPRLLDAAGRVERLRAALLAAESEPPPPIARERIEVAKAAAADLEAAQHAVRAAAAEKLAAEAAPRIMPCPHCTGSLTVTAAGAIVAAGAEPAHDHARIARAVREHAIAQERLRAAERNSGAVTRANDAAREAAEKAQRDHIAGLRAELRTAESAAAELPIARAALAAIDVAMPYPDPIATDAAERSAALAAALRAAEDRQRQLQEVERAVVAAIDRTARAADAYADAQAWVALGDAVEALPNEMLAAGLAPLNAALRDLAGSGADWLRTPDGLALAPMVAPDMAILCGQRPYRALSESEQWRVDAVLGAAIACLSNHRILVLDRLDVVQPDLRTPVLAWLRDLLGSGLLHTAVVLATTREPFRVPAGVESVRLPAERWPKISPANKAT